MAATKGKQGKHYRFRSIEFWAENGLVIFTDERFPPEDDRSLDVLLVREFLGNIGAINLEIGHMRYSDERLEHQNLVENGIRCAKEAQKQGRPDDPKAVAQIVRDRRRSWALGNGSVGRNSRHGSTILHTTSASNAPEQNALLPPMPRHPATDPAEISLVGRNRPQSRRSIIIP